eukprot:753972-Hanusia_phi.AAC.2
MSRATAPDASPQTSDAEENRGEVEWGEQRVASGKDEQKEEERGTHRVEEGSPRSETQNGNSKCFIGTNATPWMWRVQSSRPSRPTRRYHYVSDARFSPSQVVRSNLQCRWPRVQGKRKSMFLPVEEDEGEKEGKGTRRTGERRGRGGKETKEKRQEVGQGTRGNSRNQQFLRQPSRCWSHASARFDLSSHLLLARTRQRQTEARVSRGTPVKLYQLNLISDVQCPSPAPIFSSSFLCLSALIACLALVLIVRVLHAGSLDTEVRGSLTRPLIPLRSRARQHHALACCHSVPPSA